MAQQYQGVPPVQVMQPGQPAQSFMMPQPEKPPNCPPGLEYLCLVDHLFVKQKVEYLEVLTDIETANKYKILNSLGQQVYCAKEETNFCVRNICGKHRPFKIKIENNFKQEIMNIERKFRITCGHKCMSCCACCLERIVVEAPIGVVLGYVEQNKGCKINFDLKNENLDSLLKIQGPFWPECHCPGSDVPFYLQSIDGNQEIGRISKEWGNVLREGFSDADNFGVNFPLDLDVKVKGLVLAAIFLIDFMFFEDNV